MTAVDREGTAVANREGMAPTGPQTLAVRVPCGYSLVAGTAAGTPPAGPGQVREAAARTDEAGEAAMTAAASIQ
jgi:hypothetical protein